MTQTTVACWETRRTDEARHVEEVLRNAGFERADAYRYNPASIRVRVIDSRFEGLSPEEAGRHGRTPSGAPSGAAPRQIS